QAGAGARAGHRHLSGRPARVLPPRQLHLRRPRLPQPDLRPRECGSGRALGAGGPLPALRQDRERGARGRDDQGRSAGDRAPRQRPEPPREREARADDEGRRVSSAGCNCLDACGCCEDQGDLTPLALENPPGLSELAYRVGTHGSFKETMIRQLPVAGPAGHPLSALTTREDDDPTIGLIDAWASVLDVLTFYQE